MVYVSVDWDSIVGSLYRSKGSLATKVDSFRHTLLEASNYKTADCYILHESGTYLRPIDFNGEQTVIGYAELRRPDNRPPCWEIELHSQPRPFPASDIYDRYVVIMTTTPTGVENGAVLLGYHANQNLPAEQKITSCSASFLRHQIGALIDEHQNETEKNQKTAQSAAYFSASMDVTLDSYIIYDEQDRVSQTVSVAPSFIETSPL